MRIPDSADHSRNAFDLLRFLAAFAVLFSHSFPLYGLREPFLGFGLPLANSAVYVFFVWNHGVTSFAIGASSIDSSDSTSASGDARIETSVGGSDW